jgi:hypothetical protein
MRSPTFHRLMDARTGPIRRRLLPDPNQPVRPLNAELACRLTIAGPHRNILVRIEARGSEDRPIGVIGHELQGVPSTKPIALF